MTKFDSRQLKQNKNDGRVENMMNVRIAYFT